MHCTWTMNFRVLMIIIIAKWHFSCVSGICLFLFFFLNLLCISASIVKTRTELDLLTSFWWKLCMFHASVFVHICATHLCDVKYLIISVSGTCLSEKPWVNKSCIICCSLVPLIWYHLKSLQLYSVSSSGLILMVISAASWVGKNTKILDNFRADWCFLSLVSNFSCLIWKQKLQFRYDK